MNSMPGLVLLGAGGHAKVLQALLSSNKSNLVGVSDPHLKLLGVTHWRDLVVLGDDEDVLRLDPGIIHLVNGVGHLIRNNQREKVFSSMRSNGFYFPAIIHPTAWISSGVSFLDGVQVMAGVIIQADCTIGSNTIINTKASIDHDCQIGDHVHIAPGVTLCGGVVIADDVFIGAGSIIGPGVSIGKGAIIGAGVTLTRDLQSLEFVLPAKNSIRNAFLEVG